MHPSIELAYQATSVGRLHYATMGSGDPVLCLHQTPRSWDEYLEILPLLAPTRRAIAMDTPGMGQSDSAGPDASIEQYAAAGWALCDALDLSVIDLIGHHTGGVIAVEMAAIRPEQVRRMVLSSTPYVDAESRHRRSLRKPVDHVVPDPDGQHVMELWRGRARFYPESTELLSRFLRDALTADDPATGHRAVDRYQMEHRIRKLSIPVLCVGHARDPFAFPELERLSSVLPQAETETLPNGMVPLEYQAEAFARIVEPFLAGRGGSRDAPALLEEPTGSTAANAADGSFVGPPGEG